MAVKPDSADSRWDTDETNMTTPSSGQRDTGIEVGAVAVSSYINYLLHQADLWAQYVDDGSFAGAFSLVSDISPTAITGTQSNYAPTGISTAQVIRQDLSGAASIGGLNATADGRIIVILNIHASLNLTLLHADGGSTAALSFLLPNSVNFVIPPRGSAIIQYDSTTSRWRLIGGKGHSTTETLAAITASGALHVDGAIDTDSTFLADGLITAGAGLTASANQHVTVSGTGLFKHGTKSAWVHGSEAIEVSGSWTTPVITGAGIQDTGGNPTHQFNIYVPEGARLTAIYVRYTAGGGAGTRTGTFYEVPYSTGAPADLDDDTDTGTTGLKLISPLDTLGTKVLGNDFVYGLRINLKQDDTLHMVGWDWDQP